MALRQRSWGPLPHIAIVWGGREKDFQWGEGKTNQRHHMMDEARVIMGTVSNLKRVDVQEAEVPA